MKKILIGIGIVLAVLVVVVIAVPFLVPVDTYKGQIEQRVEAATGRKLTIAGPVKFSLLPSLAIVAKDVRFANVPGAADPNMATLAGLEVKLKLMPLLSGEIAVDSFVLDKPVINLETDKQGRGNWQFAETKPQQAPAQQAPSPAAPESSSGGLSDLRLDNVRLSDGRLTYRDGQTGQTYMVEAVNVALSLPDLDSPFRADGGLTWNGKPVKLRAEVSSPRALMEGKGSAFSTTVNSDLLRVDFQGSATNGQPFKLEGGLDMAITNVRSLAAWVGQKLDVPGSALGPFALKGKLALAGAKASFTGAELSLDALRATGDVSVDGGGKVPFVKAKLETNTLDLNPYLPASTATATRPSGPPAPDAAVPTPRSDEGWSTDPLDFSGFRAVDADLALGVEGLVIRKIKIGKGHLDVHLKGGKLEADLTELALYDGNAKGKVTLDGSGKMPAVGFDLALAEVQAEPLLRDVMELDRLTGRMAGDVRVNGSGASQAELMKALNGKGGIKFENGAIKGVNLGAMVRNVSTAFLDAQAGRAQQTDFSELSGTYVIDKGILKNDDLTMQAPLLRLAGAGTVNLPQRTIDYRVEPKVVASAEGQGGRQEAGGIMVPVVIQGPWDNISYKPDLGALLKDPEKAVDQLRGIIGGERGGGESGGSQPSNPVDQLRGLFGR